MSAEKYHIRVPDLEYYQGLIKCQAACPVRTDAKGYVTAIAEGDLAKAYQIARTPNPLASICGRVCNAPCEAACRRANIDEPIAIRPLKRLVTERYGVESKHLLPKLKVELDESRPPQLGNTTTRSRAALKQLAATPNRKMGRVAVIGSGPAGLGCAHDLAELGHNVTIFDAGAEAGGALRMGIPLYRLDRDLLTLEIEQIVAMGIELRLNTPIGQDITFAALRRDFDAIFIATGLGQGRSLRIPGADMDGVLIAVDFLLNVNMGYKVDLGKQVIVIGGGNVAVDAARMVLRHHQAEGIPLTEQDKQVAADNYVAPGSDESLHTAVDVARTALRLGVADVKMLALESWAELPASEIELEETLEEGIQIHPSFGPNKILGQSGQVSGLETLSVASVFDKDGRFSPTFIPDSEKVWPCDTIILAIGQAAELDFLGQDHDVEISPRGLLVADPQSGATSAAGIYAGGDVVYGPRILIEAVRDGQRAARSIDSQIQGKGLSVKKESSWTVHENHRMPDGYIDRSRSHVPTLPLERRIGISEVETGYDEAEAMAQAERCLNCGINTIFDASKCILCNGCVDVCPWSCLKLVDVRNLTGNDDLAAAISATYSLTPEELTHSDTLATAMLKNDDLCTRCGLCAQRCPTGAITMETFSFKETLHYIEL